MREECFLPSTPNFATGRVPEPVPIIESAPEDSYREPANEDSHATPTPGRFNALATGAGLLAIQEAGKLTPVAEMTAACGCGACGVCRTAFAGGVITAVTTKVKSFFGRKAANPQPEA